MFVSFVRSNWLNNFDFISDKYIEECLLRMLYIKLRVNARTSTDVIRQFTDLKKTSRYICSDNGKSIKHEQSLVLRPHFTVYLSMAYH